VVEDRGLRRLSRFDRGAGRSFRTAAPATILSIFSPGVKKAVDVLFGIVTRYADAHDFAVPTANEFGRATTMLLKRHYAS
jgi:hypothetical protein